MPQAGTGTEREQLIEAMARHRGFLLHTAAGLTEEQAHARSTVSELTIAGLLKHVADTEEQWMDFGVRGAEAFATSQVYEAGVDWSLRRVALHVLAEVSQHAGHADIIREAIDGQRAMG
jgi:uncharacterized damage-inducible protein DinB